MAAIRRLLVPMALAWLLIHAGVLAGTTALLLASTADVNIHCACAHGADHGACPMHQRPSDTARCRLQNAERDLGLAMRVLFGPAPVPAAAGAPVPLLPVPVALGCDVSMPFDWIAPPDAPPPRD